MTRHARRAFLARATAFAAGAAARRPAFAQVAPEPFDLVIKGGRVIDAARDLHGQFDIGIRAGRIAALEPEIPAAAAKRVIDAKGRLVTPGLIDLHAHVYAHGSAAAADADDLVAQTGAITFVSAGDAGAASFAAFKRYVATRRRCRIYAFVNIAAVGSSRYPAAEALDLGDANVDATARTIADNHDIVLGASVRQSASVVGAQGLEPLKRAIEAVDRSGTRGRVMCHIGAVPGNLSDLLDLLRPRDILTHVYSGAGNDIVRNGKVLAAAVAARNRGVVLDVGHGGASFDYGIAEPAIQQGLLPDVISSGVRASSGTPPAPLLPLVMSQFLDLGFTLEQVIAMTTINPARIIGRHPGLGTLALGTPADVSILELVDAPMRFVDARRNVREARRWLRPVQAIRSGVVVGSPDATRIRSP